MVVFNMHGGRKPYRVCCRSEINIAGRRPLVWMQDEVELRSADRRGGCPHMLSGGCPHVRR